MEGIFQEVSQFLTVILNIEEKASRQISLPRFFQRTGESTLLFQFQAVQLLCSGEEGSLNTLLFSRPTHIYFPPPCLV